VVEVIAEQGFADFAERLVDRRDLREHIYAITVLVHHALDAADLTFDALEAIPWYRINGAD